MRILHVTPDYYPALGGGELYAKEISERLAARGHTVSVLAMNSRGVRLRNGELPPATEVLNQVHIQRLNRTYTAHRRLLRIRGAERALSLTFGSNRARMLYITPWSMRAFVMTLRARADVVAAFNWYHGTLAYQTRMARDLARFAFVGVPFCHTERPWPHSLTLAHTFARCDAVAVMTEHEQRFVEERSGRPNAFIAGAGIEPSDFADADGARVRRQYGIGDAPLIGYIGRISPTKGVTTLLDAMRIVWQEQPAAKLLLAGSGLPTSRHPDADVATLWSALADHERSKIITASGFTDADKVSMFDALDVFVMPSTAESFGMTYLEAWMCRKPVIGGLIPSTRCVIDDGVDGLLVDPFDPVRLAAKIDGLLRNPARRQAMGEAGYAKTIARFTWDKVVDRFERIYLESRSATGRHHRERHVA